MNSVERRLILGLSGILLATTALADVTGNADSPYQVIVVRNPFGLKPPPPVVTNQLPTNPVVPVNVKLTGITFDPLSGKKAWLMIPPKPGKNATPKYLSMAEGDVDDDLKILEINEKEETVKVLNAGVTAVLDFQSNGLPAPTALPVPGLPGAPGNPHGVLPRPGVPPPTIRTTASPAASYNGAAANRYGLQSATTANSAIRTIPARNVRTTAVQPNIPATEAHVDPAVQRVMMEAQRVQAQQQGIPFPPLPPLPGAPNN